MVSVELEDDDCVPTIRDFVRNSQDFEISQYIRRGCNGEVYFGRRIKLDDEVVLKFYWSQPGFVETEEAVILRKIKHDNILSVYDLRFVEPHFAFFLSPKISGGDLQGIIDNQVLSTKTALEIVSGILMGLTELHSSHQLVHRDLKPGNILIDLAATTPIIADLGAVKRIGQADGFVTASKTTELYLPPEAIANKRYYFQSDIYQVGLILFQLLGGFFPINEPYKWLSRREMMQIMDIRNFTQRDIRLSQMLEHKIIKGRLVDVNSLPPYLDSQFKRVLKKALHLNHNQRYHSTAMFLREVHNLLRNQPEFVLERDRLIVSHGSGKQYAIYNTRKGIVLEKKTDAGEWRKDNSHEGSFESALLVAKANR